MKCAFYHHLRTKLGKLLNENNLCIYTEHLGSEFKELGYRPDMVVVKMKKDCDEKYLINHIEEVVVAFEFKFKDKYEFNTIVADADKIYNYIKRINNNCQYVMAIIHEKYWENPFWLTKKQTNNWAKGRVTELVASYNDEITEEMNFLSKGY